MPALLTLRNMKIVADQAIPLVKESFETIGELVALPASEIDSSILRDADVLLVRTRTKVNRELLEGTSVRFVASATAGTDHVTIPYLKESGIAFYNAAGCNANAVAEYVFAALSWLSEKYGFDLSKKSIGIIGVGNVGSRVAQKAELLLRNCTSEPVSLLTEYAQALERRSHLPAGADRLGMKVLRNDPPKARELGEDGFVSLSEALQADIITFHVPLTKSGEDATYHLGNAETLGALKPDAIVLNTSRGPVVDNQVLKALLKEKKIKAAILDVWENEPNLDRDLLDLVDFATPHVAGYSQEAKKNATRMIYEATCEQFNLERSESVMRLFKSEKAGEILLPSTIQNSVEAVAYAFRKVYDIRADDSEMRNLLSMQEEEASRQFESLRNNYQFRRECSAFEIKLDESQKGFEGTFRDLGFQLK